MSDIDAGVLEKVARAISAAGMAWLKEKDPLSKRTDFGWADVPDEVFARAAISAYEDARAGITIEPVELGDETIISDDDIEAWKSKMRAALNAKWLCVF